MVVLIETVFVSLYVSSSEKIVNENVLSVIKSQLLAPSDLGAAEKASQS